MWIEGNYRRNLMDMHIDDWNPEFLSRIDIDEYVDALKDIMEANDVWPDTERKPYK